MISYGFYVPAEYGRMGDLEVTNCDIKLGRQRIEGEHVLLHPFV